MTTLSLIFTKAKQSELALVSLLVLSAFCLRLLHIGNASLWFDEGWSLWLSRFSFADLFGPVAKVETNPPLYFAILKVWIQIFGDGEVAIRLLSTVFSAATIVPVYLCARWAAPEGTERKSALLAAILFALAFVQLRYAQEARTYAMLTLALAGACASLMFIARHHRSTQPLSIAPFALLGTALALVVWSHDTGIIYVTLAALFAIVWWIVAAGASSKIFVKFVVCALFFLILASPALWIQLHQSYNEAQNFWLQAPNAGELTEMFTRIFGAAFAISPARWDFLLRLALFAPWPVLGFWSALRSSDQTTRWAGIAMAVLSAGAFTVFALVTFAFRPIMIERVLVPMQIGWLVLCAFSPLAFQPQYRAVAAVTMMCCFLAGTLGFETRADRAYYRENWREMTSSILVRSPGPTLIVTSEIGGELISYYVKRSDARPDIRLMNLPAEPQLRLDRSPDDPDKGLYAQPMDSAIDQLAWILETEPSVWIILRSPEQAPNRAPLTLDLLRAHGISQPSLRFDKLFAYHVEKQNKGSETQQGVAGIEQQP